MCNAAELLLSAKKRAQRSRSIASAGGDDEAAEALRRLNIEDVTASHAAEIRVYTAAAADADVAVALALSPLFRRLRGADSLGSGGGKGASAGGAAAAAAIERAAADEDNDEAPSTPQRLHFLSRCCPSANRSCRWQLQLLSVPSCCSAKRCLQSERSLYLSTRTVSLTKVSSWVVMQGVACGAIPRARGSEGAGVVTRCRCAGIVTVRARRRLQFLPKMLIPLRHSNT